MVNAFPLIRFLPLLLAIVFMMAAARSRASETDDGSKANVYATIVGSYLRGNWDELAGGLKTHAAEIAGLPPARKTDVEYIRRSVLECRPDWWALCKAGRLVKFRPVVWGRAISATFGPSAQSNLSITYLNGQPSVTLKWDAADMDNPAIKGELEFTKGEHSDLDMWTALGTAQSWSLIPPRGQLNLSEAERTQLKRYLSFRGNITGAYYVSAE